MIDCAELGLNDLSNFVADIAKFALNLLGVLDGVETRFGACLVDFFQ